MTIQRLCSLGALIALASAGSAAADQLTLANGDRLSGTVISKAGDTLVFKTAYAGPIRVQWSEVRGLATDGAVNVVLDDETDMKATLLPTDAGKARMKAGRIVETAPFDLARVKFINPTEEQSGKGVRLSGRANVGVTAARGNSENDRIHLDGEVVARTKVNRYTLGGSANRARNSGVKTESNARGYMKYDHFLGDQWFAYANGSFENDDFKDIDLRTTLGLGAGYQFVESRELNLSLEGGLNYVAVDRALGVDENYPAARWAVSYDQWLWMDRVQFFHQHEGLLSLEDSEELFILSRTGLRFPLTEHLTGTAQLNVDWDKSPTPGRAAADKTMLFNLGYAW